MTCRPSVIVDLNRLKTYTVYQGEDPLTQDYGHFITADSFKEAAKEYSYIVASEGEVIPDFLIVQLGSKIKKLKCSSSLSVVIRELSHGGEA